MSAERDLLRRAKCLLECSNMEPLQRQSDNIVEGIKELLAQPETEPSDAEIITAYQMLVRRKLGLQEKNEILQLGVEE